MFCSKSVSSDRLSTANINLWWESALASLSTGIGYTLSLLTVIALSALLPVDEVGLYFFFLAFVYIGIQIPKGIGTGIKKRVSSVSTNKQKKQYLIASIVINSFTLVIISSMSFLTLLFDGYISIDITLRSLIIVNITVFGYTILKVGQSYLSGVGSPGMASQIKNYVGNGLKLILISSGVYLYPTYEVGLLMYSLSYAISGIICLYLALDSYKIIKPRIPQYFELYNFIKWSVPNTLINDMYSRFDTLLIGALIGSVIVSYYDVPIRLAYIGTFVSVGISTSANIKISGMYESGDSINNISRKIIGAAPLFIIPFFGIILINPELILSLVFGSEYTAAKWFLVGLTFHRIIGSFRYSLESILNAIDYPAGVTKPSLLAIIINIITAIPLVLIIGGIGAVISTILSEFMRILYLNYIVKDKLGEYIFHIFIIKQLSLFVLLIPSLLIFNSYMIPEQTIEIFIIQTSTVLLIYYISLYILSPLFREMLSDINNGFKNLIS